jgi:hypothetical protein
MSNGSESTTIETEGPPAGYEPCKRGCGRWSQSSGAGETLCWVCYFKGDVAEADAMVARNPRWADWTPPGRQAVESPEVRCQSEIDGVHTTCDELVTDGVCERCDPPRAKPAEAPECDIAREHHMGPVLLRHMFKDNPPTMACESCAVVHDLNAAINTPSTGTYLPASYTLPKSAPYVPECDELHWVEDVR